jgi:hypothetical protein
MASLRYSPTHGDQVDLLFAIVLILALNVLVFLAGCLVAAYRTWGPSARARGHRHETHETNGTIPH